MKSDCYIGIKECGCVVAVVIDRAEYKKDTAKSVADFIKRGYRVEAAVLEEVRHKLGSCKCKPSISPIPDSEVTK